MFWNRASELPEAKLFQVALAGTFISKSMLFIKSNKCLPKRSFSHQNTLVVFCFLFFFLLVASVPVPVKVVSVCYASLHHDYRVLSFLIRAQTQISIVKVLKIPSLHKLLFSGSHTGACCSSSCHLSCLSHRERTVWACCWASAIPLLSLRRGNSKHSHASFSFLRCCPNKQYRCVPVKQGGWSRGDSIR